MKGIRSNTELNAAADAIAHRGKGGRASSTAPPSPAPKPKATGPLKTEQPKTKVPKPAASDGATPGSQGKHVTINIHT